jgi:hypothetical protein
MGGIGICGFRFDRAICKNLKLEVIAALHNSAKVWLSYKEGQSQLRNTLDFSRINLKIYLEYTLKEVAYEL